MRPPSISPLVNNIDKLIRNLQQYKGTIESLGVEPSQLARNHLRNMIPGWLRRLNMSYWWIMENSSSLLDELREDNANAAKENQETESSE